MNQEVSKAVDNFSRNNTNEHHFWCSYIRQRCWTNKQKRILFDHFKSISTIYNAAYNEVRDVIQADYKPPINVLKSCALENDLVWLSLPSNDLITLNDSRYPDSLKQLSDPPLALFATGNVGLLNEPQISIVGSRRPTPVGTQAVKNISSELAQLGLVITSGMALGIDGQAHAAALGVNGSTIAVMGCGLDIVYPSRNVNLHREIGQRGLLLSEFPLGVRPTKYSFPMRNRIVSGLSLGVVIVEAAINSGTLITASFASEQGKEVMVLPGSSLSRQYEGSHQLIRNGAALVCTAEEVLHCLERQLKEVLKNCQQVKPPADKLIQPNLLEFIGADSTPIDMIISNSGLTAAEVSSMLIELELSGMVAVAHDGGFVNLQ